MGNDKATLWLQYLINEDLFIVREDQPAESGNDVQQQSAPPTAAEEPAAAPPTSQENGLRDLLIAYTKQGDPEADSRDRELLQNILKAIKKDPSEVYLHALDSEHTIIDDTQLKRMPHTTAILFGPGIQYRVHRSERLYTIGKHGDCTVVQVDDLRTLGAYKLKKKALWNVLQKLFKI
jgi:hypothetical protein